MIYETVKYYSNIIISFAVVYFIAGYLLNFLSLKLIIIIFGLLAVSIKLYQLFKEDKLW